MHTNKRTLISKHEIFNFLTLNNVYYFTFASVIFNFPVFFRETLHLYSDLKEGKISVYREVHWIVWFAVKRITVGNAEQWLQW